VSSNGENIYPEDVEARLDQVEHVAELCVVGISDGRRGERVACVAVPDGNAAASRGERRERARKSLDSAILRLPQALRPAVVVVIDAPLPRTGTRKVKRAEVRRLVERSIASNVPATAQDESLDATARAVRSVVATIARRTPAEISAAANLRGDLGFDSLMLLELLVALEAQRETTLDAERLGQCQTVGDVEEVLREHRARRAPSAQTSEIEATTERDLVLPPVLREAAMAWMGRAQRGFYDSVLRTQVTGRAFIPHNRNELVAANHSSHLDMGLAKYALGSYGDDLVSLAAHDYFFEGHRWRKTYFENFTNLVPISRHSSLRQSLRQAGALLDQGKTVLIFPEGTRSTDGSIGEFKPAVGHLALHHGVDILPIYLGGTHAALPKG